MEKLYRNSEVNMNQDSADFLLDEYGTLNAWYSGVSGDFRDMSGLGRNISIGDLFPLAPSLAGPISGHKFFTSDGSVLSSRTQTAASPTWLRGKVSGCVAFTASKKFLDTENSVNTYHALVYASGTTTTTTGSRFRVSASNKTLMATFAKNRTSRASGDFIVSTTYWASGVAGSHYDDLLDYNSIVVSWDFTQPRASDTVIMCVNGYDMTPALNMSPLGANNLFEPGVDPGVPNLLSNDSLIIGCDAAGGGPLPSGVEIGNFIFFDNYLSRTAARSLSLNMLNPVPIGLAGQSNSFVRINGGYSGKSNPSGFYVTGQTVYGMSSGCAGDNMIAGSYSFIPELIETVRETFPQINGKPRHVAITGYDAGGCGFLRSATNAPFYARHYGVYLETQNTQFTPGNYVKSRQYGSIDKVVEYKTGNNNLLILEFIHRDSNYPDVMNGSVLDEYRTLDGLTVGSPTNVSGVLRRHLTLTARLGTFTVGNYIAGIDVGYSGVAQIVEVLTPQAPVAGAILVSSLLNSMDIGPTIRQYDNKYRTGFPTASGVLAVSTIDVTNPYSDITTRTQMVLDAFPAVYNSLNFLKREPNVLLTNMQDDLRDLTMSGSLQAGGPFRESPWSRYENEITLSTPEYPADQNWRYYYEVVEKFHNHLKLNYPNLILGLPNTFSFLTTAGVGTEGTVELDGINHSNAIRQYRIAYDEYIKDHPTDAFYFRNDIFAEGVNDLKIDMTNNVFGTWPLNCYFKVINSVSNPDHIGLRYKGGATKINIPNRLYLLTTEDATPSDMICPSSGDMLAAYTDMACTNLASLVSGVIVSGVVTAHIHYNQAHQDLIGSTEAADAVSMIYGFGSDPGFGYTRWSNVDFNYSTSKRVQLHYDANTSASSVAPRSGNDYTFGWLGRISGNTPYSPSQHEEFSDYVYLLGHYIQPTSATIDETNTYITLEFSQPVSELLYDEIIYGNTFNGVTINEEAPQGPGEMYERGYMRVFTPQASGSLVDDLGRGIISLATNWGDYTYSDNIIVEPTITPLDKYQKVFTLWRGGVSRRNEQQKYVTKVDNKETKKILDDIAKRQKRRAR